MVRKLKFHEQKLLKKVDFISWEVDNNLNEVKVMKKYYIQKREDYTKYNKLSRQIRELVRKIKDLDANDPFRVDCSGQMLEKLYVLGLIPNKRDLSLCDKVTASSFCRRRLPFIVVKSHMAQALGMATKLVQQGHIRVGPEVIKDPAFLVSRNLEDFVTWVDTSAIRKHVMEYNDMSASLTDSTVRLHYLEGLQGQEEMDYTVDSATQLPSDLGSGLNGGKGNSPVSELKFSREMTSRQCEKCIALWLFFYPRVLRLTGR